MVPPTLSCTTGLERPGLPHSPLYHYLKLFTAKCLAWMGCGVECSSPQRSRFLHILRPCPCLMFVELMSCAACNVLCGDVSKGFSNTRAVQCGFMTFGGNTQSGNSSFFFSMYLTLQISTFVVCEQLCISSVAPKNCWFVCPLISVL